MKEAAILIPIGIFGAGYFIWRKRKKKRKPKGIQFLAAGESTMRRTGADGEYKDATPVTYVQLNSEHRCALNIAEGGERSNATRIKIKNALKKHAVEIDAVFVATGINDVIGNIHEDNIINNMRQIRALCKSYRVKCHFLHIPLCPGFSETQKAKAARINATIGTMYLDYTDEDFVDKYHFRLDRYHILGKAIIGSLGV